MELTMQVIQQYLYACETQKKLNAKTVKAYRIDLRQFCEYLNIQALVFDREALKSYIAQMNLEYQPRTVKRKIASIRALVTWLLDERLLEINPFDHLRAKVQEPMLLPKVIPLRLIEDLLKAAHTALTESPDNRCILCDTAVIEMLFATGMRVSELCGLKTKDVNLVDGIIRILGKGAKERIIQLTNGEVLTTLRRYLEQFQPERDGAFFRNRRGNRLSEQSVRIILRKYAKKAGILTRITPHMIRHSLATLLLEEGVDIRYIQHLLGHSSVLTTQIYTHVSGAKQREIMTAKHPRNKFSCRNRDNSTASRHYTGNSYQTALL